MHWTIHDTNVTNCFLNNKSKNVLLNYFDIALRIRSSFIKTSLKSTWGNVECFVCNLKPSKIFRSEFAVISDK